MGPTLLLTRWRAGGDLRRVLPATVGALLIGVGLLVVPGPASTPVRLGLSMVWCVAAVWRAWATRPSLLVLARDLDVRAGTDGLLATALAVEQGRAHGDAGLQAAAGGDQVDRLVVGLVNYTGSQSATAGLPRLRKINARAAQSTIGSSIFGGE